MRGAWIALPLLLAPALVLAASAPVEPPAESLEVTLKRAQAEAAAADAEVLRLETAAKAALDEATRLRASQQAAAEVIDAAEARISAAETRARIVAANVAARRARLQREQAPAASLMAGLALMAQRPPLVAIADNGSTEEFVRVLLLLDSTLPVIRARTAALTRDVARGRALEQAAITARDDLVRSRDELKTRRRAFAALETKALDLARRSGTDALNAGDIALAQGEQVDELTRRSLGATSTARLAADLARLGPAPPRPFRAEGDRAPPPLHYLLPSPARVTEGLGAISGSGVRSRGLTLATPRGSQLLVPASGVVRFAGPFRSHDGIVIIDHGAGWMSLILNVGTRYRRGDKVEAGALLGRALGPVGVELTHRGTHVSPALIAGSSQMLSNRAKGG